jgi:hypothetical protein
MGGASQACHTTKPVAASSARTSQSGGRFLRQKLMQPLSHGRRSKGQIMRAHAASRSTATASRLSPRGREHGAGRDHYRQSGAATIRATRPSDRKARSWFTIRGQSAHASAGSAWRKRKTRLTRGEAGRGNTQGSFRRVPDAQVPGSRAIGLARSSFISAFYGTWTLLVG